MQELISQIEEMGIEINHTNSLVIIFGIIFLTAIIVHLILHRLVLLEGLKRQFDPNGIMNAGTIYPIEK